MRILWPKPFVDLRLQPVATSEMPMSTSNKSIGHAWLALLDSPNKGDRPNCRTLVSPVKVIIYIEAIRPAKGVFVRTVSGTS